MKWTLAGVCAIWALAAGGPAAGNEAYKCGPNSYSQYPCSEKKINTEEHRAPAARKGGALGGARRLPGESDAEFALRSRRASLPMADQDECKRLDAKIPFEQERLKKAVRAEDVAEVQEVLGAALRRFGQLGC